MHTTLHSPLTPLSRITRAHFAISSSSCSRSPSGELDEAPEVVRGQRRRRKQTVRYLRHARDRREVAAHVVTEAPPVVSHLYCERCGGGQQQRVAVRRSLRDALRGDVATVSGPVVHQNALVEAGAERVRERAIKSIRRRTRRK